MNYKKIPINGENDLPKEDGNYLSYDIKGWRCRPYSLKYKQDWLTNVACYFLEVAQPLPEITDEDIEKQFPLKAPVMSNGKTDFLIVQGNHNNLMRQEGAKWLREINRESKRELLIRFGTQERTRAKKIAYEFYDKYNEEAKSLKSIGGNTNKMLSDRRKQKADIARQIGNAISGSNALTGNETIEDRITIVVDEFLTSNDK